MSEAAKRGRKPDHPSGKRTRRADMRLHDDELEAYRKAAEPTGLDPMAWLRAVGLVAAGRTDLLEQLRRVSSVKLKRVSRIETEPSDG